MNRCDIIIPIYNAYDALVECIDSVIANTDLNKNGLILINDCSSDEKIKPYLDKLSKKHNKINLTILDNEKNLGFVGTVNKGMKYSTNDVLLLNSDTVVGKEWLEKIKKCAYSMPKVATVTPLSNNATLVSVPKGLQRNEVPVDMDIDKYNDMIDKCSYHDYPEIPTGHGFCMYIKREVLDLVGFFDEKTFERGYGEENDFSFRCIDYGYRNIMCDDVLVYHKESQSFSGERQKVIDEHLKKLEKRYPEYKTYLDDWCMRFPINYICKNVEYYTNINKKRNILILIHDWETNTGGTTLHVKDLVNNLKDKYNFHVLYKNDLGYALHSYFGTEENVIYFPSVDTITKFNRYNSQYREMVRDIILAFAIDTVHIHHMIAHYFDIANLAKEYNLNSIITLHDYYSLCPSINLLYCGEKYCLDLDNKDCTKCLSMSNKINNNIINDWQNDWHSFLKKFNKIIVPSEDAKKRINHFYNDLTIEAIEHGIDIKPEKYEMVIGDKFNVAFIGVMCNHKGGNILNQLIKIDKNNVMYHVFGKSEISSLTKNKNNYIFHGKYKREELANLLIENNINLICFFQIWPETYSYTLNEAVASGIPVLSFDIGAGAERVKKYNLGWTINKDSSLNEISEKINSIYNNKEEYFKVMESINNYKIKTTKEMSDEYEKIYDKNISATKCHEDILRKILKEDSKNISSGSNERLNAILNSTKWKLINKIKFSPKFVSFVRRIRARRKK